MRKYFLPIAILSSVFLANLDAQASLQDLQSQLSAKLQELANVTDSAQKDKLHQEILKLQSQLNAVGEARQNLMDGTAAQSPLNSAGNGNLRRDTYFYRGLVANMNYNTPYLDQSWQRGYGNNTHVMEGRPVPVLNAPNAYVNQVAPVGGTPFRNPYTNPYQRQNIVPNHVSGQNYLPPHMQNMWTVPQQSGYQNGVPGWGQFSRNVPVQNLFSGNYAGVRNQPGGFPGGFGPYSNYGYRPHPGNFNMPRGGFNYGYGGSPYGYGFGSNPYYQNIPGGWHGQRPNQVAQNQQAVQMANYDAVQRLQNEIGATGNLTGADRIQVHVQNQTKLDNGQIQITVTTSGGITGQGVGNTRYYLYTAQGIFVKQLSQPMQGGSPANQTQVTRYRVSNQQKFQIERFLAERGLNQYGDPLGTAYAGGNPLFNMQTGQNQDPAANRFNYILSNHPELVNLFKITPE